jgi:hypothetical protein
MFMFSSSCIRSIKVTWCIILYFNNNQKDEKYQILIYEQNQLFWLGCDGSVYANRDAMTYQRRPPLSSHACIFFYFSSFKPNINLNWENKFWVDYYKFDISKQFFCTKQFLRHWRTQEVNSKKISFSSLCRQLPQLCNL